MNGSRVPEGQLLTVDIDLLAADVATVMDSQGHSYSVVKDASQYYDYRTHFSVYLSTKVAASDLKAFEQSIMNSWQTQLGKYHYCKFGNFCEGFIFVKFRICKVSRKRPSGNDNITLRFTDVGNSCFRRKSICCKYVFYGIRENKILITISEFTVFLYIVSEVFNTDQFFCTDN